MSRREKLFWLCAGAGLIVLVFSVVPSHYEVCEVAEKTKEKDCASYQAVPFALIKFGQFLDRIGVAVTALATIAIAGFTFTLKAATDRLWKAGGDQLDHARDTAERQLRAYVGVSDASIYKVETGAPEAIVNFRNFGQTPAYDVRAWISMWIAEYPLTVTVLPDDPGNLEKSKSVVYPGTHLAFTLSKKPPVPAESIPLLGTPAGTIYVHGGITYRDAFNRNRTTKFRLIYGGREPPLAPYMKHDQQGSESD